MQRITFTTTSSFYPFDTFCNDLKRELGETLYSLLSPKQEGKTFYSITMPKESKTRIEQTIKGVCWVRQLYNR
jgi:hypothetical protein